MINAVITNPTLSKKTMIIEVYETDEWLGTIGAHQALEVLETVLDDDYFDGDAEDFEKVLAIRAAYSALRLLVEQAEQSK
jgi:hypothetical protein